MIKFLQDAAGKGELDPWDIDVISVIDSFLEQYSHTFNQSSNNQISYHKDLAETSEAFFAASVLVNLKAQVLESDVFKENSSDFEDEFDLDDQDWIDKEFDIPKYPEKYLRRHREKLPETTKALGKFIEGWEKALQWTDFEYLVKKWQTVVKNDLDKDRLGVFWALLFLSSENKIEIKQINSLYGPIQIKRIIPDGGLAQLPIENLEVSNTSSSAA